MRFDAGEVRPATAHRPQDLGDPLLERDIEDHRPPGEAADDAGGEVIGGRSETAARDDKADAERGAPLERCEHVIGAVADDRHVREIDTELEEARGKPGTVAIAHAAAEQLGAGDDDCPAHAHVHSSRVGVASFLRSFAVIS